jgi:hypothetical protein
MNEEALDHIRFVTRHFNDLQGLRLLVPLGLITLGLGGTIHFEISPMLLLGPLTVGALLLGLGARGYYRRSLGEVEAQPVYPEGELHSLSIYSPAGPVSRLEGFQQLTPVTRHFLSTILLAVSLCCLFELVPPNILVVGAETAGQHPQVMLQAPPVYDSYLWWISAFGGIFKSPAALRAMGGQMAYALFGSIFLGLWLWRERRRSQRHHLTLAVLLLGLGASGASLGFLARDGAVPPIVDLFLPALVYPGVALLLCGASLVLAGLLDHWELTRALGAIPVEEQA